MDTRDAVAAAFSDALGSESSGAGEILTLPLALSNGNLVQVYVERLESDRWLITDRGQTATELAIAGLNLDSHKSAGQSWTHLVQSLPLGPPVMLNRDGFELAGTAAAGELGAAVLAVGEAVLRGEGLVALAPAHRARRFRDVIVQAAGRHELPVLLDAPMPAQHGGQRPVTLAITTPRRIYVQAVSGKGSTLEGFDKAQAVFSSADVPQEQLVAVLAERLALQPWQWLTLRERGRPIMENELDEFMATLAV